MRNTLEYLGDQIRKHDAALTTIYTEHREKKAKNLEIFKPEEAEKQNARLIEYNRARVASADEQLSTAFGVAADRMRSALSRHATAPVNRDLVDNLRLLQDFGIKMTRTELNTYIKHAAGNLTALRVLGVVAKNSGFTLNFAGVDDLQKDIDLFDRMARTPMMVVPLDGDHSLIREAMEVLPDVPFRTEDGRVLYTMGRPTSTQVASNSAYLSNVEKEMLPAIIDRWTHNIVPTLEEIKERIAGDDEPTEEHAEAAQAEHDAAVEAAAEGVDVQAQVRGLNYKTPEEAQKEAQKSREIIAKYL